MFFIQDYSKGRLLLKECSDANHIESSGSFCAKFERSRRDICLLHCDVDFSQGLHPRPKPLFMHLKTLTINSGGEDKDGPVQHTHTHTHTQALEAANVQDTGSFSTNLAVQDLKDRTVPRHGPSMGGSSTLDPRKPGSVPAQVASDCRCCTPI